MYEAKTNTKLRKLGNSYGVIIPYRVVEDIGTDKLVLHYKNKKITLKGETNRNEKQNKHSHDTEG